MNKPSFPGSVRGQVISRVTKAKKPSKVRIEKKIRDEFGIEETEQVCISVRKNVDTVLWVWDGFAWITPKEFEAQKPQGKVFNLGGKFPSKNDFDGSGNLLPKYRR